MKIIEDNKELIAYGVLALVGAVTVQYLGRQIKYLHQAKAFDNIVSRTLTCLKETFIGSAITSYERPNSCYRDSALQMLFSLPGFKEQVLASWGKADARAQKAAAALYRLMEARERGEPEEIKSKELVFDAAICKISPLNTSNDQEDVADFLQAISNIIEIPIFPWKVESDGCNLFEFLKSSDFTNQLSNLNELPELLVINVGHPTTNQGQRSLASLNLGWKEDLKIRFFDESFYDIIAVIRNDSSSIHNGHYNVCLKEEDSWVNIDGNEKEEIIDLNSYFNAAAYVFLKRR